MRKCMEFNEPIFEKRDISTIGLDLYFYSFRTLAIFQYELLYQISEGIWSTSRYTKGHEIPWMNANLYLTKGKSNARNIVQTGCNIIKNDYNLKKVLSLNTAYNRINSIGKLVECCTDTKLVINLLNLGFHEYCNMDEWDEDFYNVMIDSLYSNPDSRELVNCITPELMQCYCNAIYSYDEMKDDLGMIQNTMRNTMSLHY